MLCWGLFFLEEAKGENERKQNTHSLHFLSQNRALCSGRLSSRKFAEELFSQRGLHIGVLVQGERATREKGGGIIC